MLLKRWVVLPLFAAFMSGNASVPAQEGNPSELLKASDDVIQAVVRLRGLPPKSPIRRAVENRASISASLGALARKEYTLPELEKEGKMLRKLGLVPQGFDYAENVVRLRSEQIEGYYDPEKKTCFIASWMPVEDQKPLMVHKAMNALQDQYFDIQRDLRVARGLRNSDRLLAHRAFFEGDALVVMLQYIIEPNRRHFSELPDLATVLEAQMLAVQSQYAVFKSAPVYLQRQLLFPYGHGASFLQKAWAANPSWQAVNDIYSDPPASTEQILHPAKYFGARDDPKPPADMNPAAALGEGWRISYDNVFGEFSLGLLLNLYLTEEHAAKAVSGWGGDRVARLENGSGQDAVFVNTVWDTEDDSDAFFLAMGEWFEHRCPGWKRGEETSTAFSIAGSGEFHRIRREGKNVYLIIGLPEAWAKKWNGF